MAFSRAIIVFKEPFQRSRAIPLEGFCVRLLQNQQPKTTTSAMARVHNQFSIFPVTVRPPDYTGIGQGSLPATPRGNSGFAFIMTACITYTCSCTAGISVTLIWQDPVNPCSGYLYREKEREREKVSQTRRWLCSKLIPV